MLSFPCPAQWRCDLHHLLSFPTCAAYACLLQRKTPPPKASQATEGVLQGKAISPSSLHVIPMSTEHVWWTVICETQLKIFFARSSFQRKQAYSSTVDKPWLGTSKPSGFQLVSIFLNPNYMMPRGFVFCSFVLTIKTWSCVCFTKDSKSQD